MLIIIVQSVFREKCDNRSYANVRSMTNTACECQLYFSGRGVN